MAMNKYRPVGIFHNMLSSQIRALAEGMNLEEQRPSNSLSIFRFFTEDANLNYVIQVKTDVLPKKYLVDIILVEETTANNETKPDLIDNKTFEVVELNVTDKTVKLISKYIRGAVKAINTSKNRVFDSTEEA